MGKPYEIHVTEDPVERRGAPTPAGPIKPVSPPKPQIVPVKKGSQ